MNNESKYNPVGSARRVNASTLKREINAIKRALKREERIAKLMCDKRTLTDRLADTRYENGTRT